jgi:tRNA threonylcarbamoyladenosine biosynthesis protein TsaB
MAIILNIDTAVDSASIALADKAMVMAYAINDNQKYHAAWLHTAIRDKIKWCELELIDLNAVAISIGPGSYTGLRIGLATAKGLCYALNIPLIAINTLQMTAHAVLNETGELICPMIDARRMEVFTAVYNKSLEELAKPSAMIIDNNSFGELLSSKTVIFCGNGAKKLQNILGHDNASFSGKTATAIDLAQLSYTHFVEKRFSNLAYTEPFYIKEFYSTSR